MTIQTPPSCSPTRSWTRGPAAAHCGPAGRGDGPPGARGHGRWRGRSLRSPQQACGALATTCRPHDDKTLARSCSSPGRPRAPSRSSPRPGRTWGADLARLRPSAVSFSTARGTSGPRITDYTTALRRFAGSLISSDCERSSISDLHAQRGDLVVRKRRLEKAAELAELANQRFLAACSLHNLGLCARRAGKASAALGDLTTAYELFSTIGRRQRDLRPGRSGRAPPAGKLLAEASVAADEALEGVRRLGNETELADYGAARRRCRLAAGRLDQARVAATESAASFRRQDAARRGEAECVLRDRSHGAPVAAAGERAEEVSRRLEQYGWSSEAAGSGAGGPAVPRRGRCRAGGRRPRWPAGRRRPAGGERAAAYLARGLLAEARCDRRRARVAVRQGLQVVAENQTSLGALGVPHIRRGARRGAGRARGAAGDRRSPPARAARPRSRRHAGWSGWRRGPHRRATTCSPSCSPSSGP